MKKLNEVMRRIYPVLGGLIVFVAVFGGVKPASIFSFHQPRVPKSIK